MRRFNRLLGACLVAAAATASSGCSEPPTGRRLSEDTTTTTTKARVEFTQAAPNSPRHSEEIPVQEDEAAVDGDAQGNGLKQ